MNEATPAQLRNWARGKGYVISNKGRIPSYIRSEYRNEKRKELAAQGTTTLQRQATRPRRVMGSNVAQNKRGSATKINKPQCPIHKTPMEHHTALGMWACTDATCKQRAWPKDGNTKPLIGTGKITLVLDGEGDQTRAYLRSDNGVLLEITQMSPVAEVEHDKGERICYLKMTVMVE